MEPEKKIIPISQGEEEPKQPNAESPKKSPPTARFIIQYAIVLLCVAFVLVTLSYFSHQQQQWANIQAEHSQFSVSALQSIQNLQEENAQYSDELSQTQQQLEDVSGELAALRAAKEETAAQNAADIDALRGDLEQAETTARDAAAAADKQREAMDALWRAENLVSARKYAAAWELLTEKRDKDLPVYLPDAVPDGMEEGTLSAAEEYARLAALLGAN